MPFIPEQWTPETTSTPIKSAHDPQKRVDNKLEETVIAPSKKADQDKKKSAEAPCELGDLSLILR